MRHEIAIGMNQKGLLCDRKGRRAHVHPSRQEALLMRLSVDSLRRVVKRDLAIEFVPQQLTSFGGLELLRRYVQRLALAARLRRACAALGGDYSGASLGLLILALLYAGARRLEHLQYLAGDPLVTRFCGLAQVPTPRTVSNWLQRFTQEHLRPLVQLNHDLVTEAIARLKLPRLTIDVDGTVIRTGATVAWAFRGFNPHHRKDPSYYPLVAHLAQTGHILRLKNRPGNVHDSKQAVAFLRELIESLRQRLGRALPLEFRMDAAFCQRDVFRLLAARRCAYAIPLNGERGSARRLLRSAVPSLRRAPLGVPRAVPSQARTLLRRSPRVDLRAVRKPIPSPVTMGPTGGVRPANCGQRVPGRPARRQSGGRRQSVCLAPARGAR